MRHFLAFSLGSVLLVGCGGQGLPTTPDPATGHTESNAPAGYAGPGGLLGAFELTFVADSTCSDLPVEARRRTYVANLHRGASLSTLSGATFVPTSTPFPAWNVLYTTVSENYAAVWFQDPPIWEALAEESYLVIFGDAHGRLSGDTAVLPFWASFQYCARRRDGVYPACAMPLTTCESTNHELHMRRLPPM